MATQDYRLNHRIRVPEVRLIDEKGEQLGVVGTNEAKRLAQDAGLDLVEVSPTARPPVCKIMDFGKFKYQQRKKDKKGAGGRNKGATGLKEMRVRPAISDHDLSYRLTDGRRFLEEGHKVQVVCIFRGRQMAHPEHGFDVMKRVASNLEAVSKVEVPARMSGRRMTMMLSSLTLEQRRKKAKEIEERDRAKAEADALPGGAAGARARVRPAVRPAARPAAPEAPAAPPATPTAAPTATPTAAPAAAPTETPPATPPAPEQ